MPNAGDRLGRKQRGCPGAERGHPLPAREIPSSRTSSNQRAPRRHRLRAGFACRRPSTTARRRGAGEGSPAAEGEGRGDGVAACIAPGRERRGGLLFFNRVCREEAGPRVAPPTICTYNILMHSCCPSPSTSNASMLATIMACTLRLTGSSCHAARNLADTTPAAAAPAASTVSGLPAVPTLSAVPTDTVILMPSMPSVTLPTVPQVTLPPMPAIVVPKAVLPPMPTVTLLIVTMAPMTAIVVPKVTLLPLPFVPNVNVHMPFAAPPPSA
ncbi:uncharacterized protein LOC123396769 [Hordeum vulgare subsp. vulgare]|nr:uncharacterized protein LOC123396769 [Hordeum vulgare subsp. vulgare]